MTTKMYEHYGMWSDPEDVYFTHLARNFAIRWSCLVGLEACQTDASAVMAMHFHEGIELDRNYDNIIACAGIRAMNETDFNLVMAQIIGTGAGPATRPQALVPLLCTYNPEFLWDILNKMVGENALWTEQERKTILETLAGRDIQALEIVLEFMKQNSDELKVIISVADVTNLFRVISKSSYSSRLSPMIRELARVFENSLGNEVIKELEVSLDSNLAWMAAKGDSVVEFLLHPVVETKPEPDAANTIVVSSFLIVGAFLISFFRSG